jgi:proteasome lid subunit RPN8/RPN11
MGSQAVAQVYKPVTIYVSKKIIGAFKQKAKENFPREVFAYLLGHTNEEKIVIDSLFYPTNVDSHCTPCHVNIQPNWRSEAKREAKQTGTQILGDCHSHPYQYDQKSSHFSDTSPSETDWDSTYNGEISAICVVQQIKNERLRARIKFWAPMPQVKVKETK